MNNVLQTLVRSALLHGGEARAGAVRAALPSLFQTQRTLDTEQRPSQDATSFHSTEPAPIAHVGSVSRAHDLERRQTATAKPDDADCSLRPVRADTAENTFHIQKEGERSRTVTSPAVQRSSFRAGLVRVDAGSDDERATVDARPVALISSVAAPKVVSRPQAAPLNINEGRAMSGPLSEPILAGVPRSQRAEQRSVNVTIDRLEVRAPPKVAAAPPGRKEQAQTPSASLSDYLRGRSG